MKKPHWTEQELTLLCQNVSTPWPALLRLLPDRSPQSISHKLSRLGISRPRPEHTPETKAKMAKARQDAWRSDNYRQNRMASYRGSQITLTQEQGQIILGTALADGHLSIPKGSINARLIFQHKEEDKDYVIWKCQQLKSIFSHSAPWPVTNDGRLYWRGESIKMPVLTKLRDEVYGPDRKKHITTGILNRLDALGLAIWYMDDGSLTFGGYKTLSPFIRLYTNRYPEVEVEMIKKWLFDKWRLRFHKYKSASSGFIKGRKYWVLGLSRKGDIERFLMMVDPYVNGLMWRKSLARYKNVRGRLLSAPLEL